MQLSVEKRKKKSNYHLNQPEHLSVLKLESHQRIRGNAPSTVRDVIKRFKVSTESRACKAEDGKTAPASCDLLPSRQAALTTLSFDHKSIKANSDFDELKQRVKNVLLSDEFTLLLWHPLG